MAFVYSALAFVIGLLVGWLVWGRRAETPAPVAAPAVVPAAAAPVVPAEPVEAAAVPLDEPAPSARFSTDDEPAPSARFSADDEPAPRRLSSIDDEPAPSVSADDEPASWRHSSLDEEPAPSPRLNVDDEPAPASYLSADEEPSPSPRPSIDEEPAPATRPHISIGAFEDEPALSPATHSAPASPASPAEPTHDAEPRPHYSAGRVDDDEPATLTRPHLSIGLVEDEPAPVAAAPVAAAPVAAAPVAAIVEPAPVVAAQPAPAVPAQRDGVGDDLKRLEGIGPKFSGVLNAAGITTFAHLADAGDAAIRSAFDAAGMRRPASAVTWPRQARLLADGDEAGFVALVRSLKGTRA